LKFINFLKDIQIRFLIKTAIILFFMLVCAEVQVYSADSTKQALLFQIKGTSLQPRSFAGGIGYQFYISDNTLIRIPLGFGIRHARTEKPKNTETDMIKDAWNLRLTPGLRYNFGFGHNVLVYTGVQAMIDYTDTTLSGIDFKTNEKISSVYSWGLGMMLGAEWFPCESLSLGLEYSPFLTFSGGSVTYKSGGFEQTDKLAKVTQFRTNFDTVMLIISFYFY